MANPPATKSAGSGTLLLFLSFGLVLLILFNEGLRLALGEYAGFVLTPLIGFNGRYPLATIFLASVILVVVTTVIRHFLVDWTNMARTQEAMRAFQREFAEARKANNTYKLKKLTEAQTEVFALQGALQKEQMKPMALTMLIVIPLFAWLAHFLETVAAGGQVFVQVPWDARWDLLMLAAPPDHPFYLLGFLPRWIILYSLFGIPFGQIAQRALKLWEYRHVDLDRDGKPAGES